MLQKFIEKSEEENLMKSQINTLIINFLLNYSFSFYFFFKSVKLIFQIFFLASIWLCFLRVIQFGHCY